MHVSTLSELRASRELLVNLTMREVRGKYKRTVLGQGWSLLNPLVSIAIFSLVFGFLLKANPPPGHPSGLDAFGLWLAGGLLPWTFFSGSAVAGMSSLIVNANLVKKVYFPREVLVSSTVFSFVVTFGIELSVLSALLLLWGGRPVLWLPLVAVAVVLLAAFALGLALLLGISNVYFRDTSYLAALIFQFWFYLTPIVYPVTLVDRTIAAHGMSPWLAHLYRLNPMERFVAVFRALLYDNRFPAWQDWLGSLTAAVVTLALGAVVFARFSRRLAEEL